MARGSGDNCFWIEAAGIEDFLDKVGHLGDAALNLVKERRLPLIDAADHGQHIYVAFHIR